MRQLAKNFDDFFRCILGVENYIKKAVKFSLSNKVMVGGMIQTETRESMDTNEMLENGTPRFVVHIDIGITSDMDLGAIILDVKLIQAGIQAR